MTPITVLVLGATCGYLTGNPQARKETFTQIQKLFGMAIDGLNKQGGNYVQPTDAAAEQSKKSEE